MTDFSGGGARIPSPLASIRDILGVRVEKAFLQNLDTGRAERFLLNPAQLDETYKANYVRHDSMGLTHQQLQFVGNDNARIPLTVFFDQIIFDQLNLKRRGATERGKNSRHTSSPNEVEQWRRFIMSLLYPRRAYRLAQNDR